MTNPHVTWEETYKDCATGTAGEIKLRVGCSPSNDYDRSDTYPWSVVHERYEDGVRIRTSAYGHAYCMRDAMLAAELAVAKVLAQIPVPVVERWNW